MKSEKSVTWQMSEAKAAAKRGDRTRAQEIYESILAKYPKNRKAQAALAALASGQKAPPRTEPWMAELQRQYDAKQFALALEGTEKALETHATHKVLRELKAACLDRLGQHEGALEIYRDRLNEDPDSAELWQKCGIVLVEMMMLKDAQECLVMASRLDPNSTQIWRNLAHCHQRRGDHQAAFDALSQALGRQPDDSDSLVRLGQVLNEMGRGELALSSFQRALAFTPSPVAKGNVLANIGVIQSSRGDKAAARNSYLAAIATDPSNVQAIFNLSQFGNDADREILKTAASTLLGQDYLDLHQRSQMNFAMFKLLDREGHDAEQTFSYLAKANALRREMIRYKPEGQASIFAYLREITNNAPTLDVGGDGPRPIFIVGLPRSGTTLTEQMLSAAPDTCAAGELTIVERHAGSLLRQLEQDAYRTTPTLAEMQSFAAKIRAELTEVAKGAPVLLDKMPLNFRWAGLVLKAFPDARVIHIRRDALETCWSNYVTSYSTHGNGFVYDQADLVHYHGLYDALTAKWAVDFPDRYRTIRYEDLVADTEPVMRGLVDFAKLDWSDGCLHPESVDRAVLTASAHQVRNAIYNGNQGKWRRYEPFISILSEGLRQRSAA